MRSKQVSVNYLNLLYKENYSSPEKEQGVYSITQDGCPAHYLNDGFQQNT